MPRTGPATDPAGGRAGGAAPGLRRGRLAPNLGPLLRYRRAWLAGDLLAGLTVAAYMVPQVLAYAQLAGVPAVAGLWACLVPLAVYAVLGSSRLLSVGPESTTALMAAVAVAPLVAGDPTRYAALLAGLSVVVGAVCLLAGLARLGTVADLLSRPVLTGYLAGVALLMISGQLGRLTGAPVSGSGFLAPVRSLLGSLGQVHPATLAMGLGVLAFLLVVREQWPRAPGPLLGVLLATAASAALDLPARGVSTVGPVPQGLPPLAWPAVTGSDLVALLLPAAGVAVVAFTDTILTARAFASRGAAAVDPQAELRALGAANLGAGLTGGFPVSSSGSRTAIAEASGGRTQAYSLVALACVAVVLLAAGDVLASFPDPALAAVVTYAALRLVDLREFRRLLRFRLSEFLLALAAMAGVLLVDILYGILVAVALSVADLLARVARPHAAVLGLVPGVPGMHDVTDFADARQVPGLVVFRYDSPLFFANAEDFRVRALDALRGQPGPVRWFLLNAEAVVQVDSTALDALRALHDRLARHGVVLCLARVKSELADDLRRGGVMKVVGEDRVFPTLPTAVAAYRAAFPADGAEGAGGGTT